MLKLADNPYLSNKKLAATSEEENAASQSNHRHDSAATIRAAHIENVTMGATIIHPTKENEWLGFCCSAVKLQNGDKKGAFKKRTDYHDSFSASGVTTLTCATKGCAFAGQISVDFIWKVLHTENELGCKCRWAFLAKSHITQSQVVGRQYQFQCPICVYCFGHAEGHIWKGVAMYLEHISTHRSKDIPSEVLSKLSIINDHIAEDREDFDLNLFPIAFTRGGGVGSNEGSQNSLILSRPPTKSKIVDTLFTRKQSTAVDAAPMVPQTSRSDTLDSVIAEIPTPEEPCLPWSAGLSEFKIFKEADYLSSDF